jgi:hypothetical protein
VSRFGAGAETLKEVPEVLQSGIARRERVDQEHRDATVHLARRGDGRDRAVEELVAAPCRGSDEPEQDTIRIRESPRPSHRVDFDPAGLLQRLQCLLLHVPRVEVGAVGGNESLNI